MFGSVKKMVSAFETRKQPHPPPSHSSPSSSTQNSSPNQQSPPPSTTPTAGLKTLPCLSTTPELHSLHISGHAPSACLLLCPITGERRHHGERDRQDVVLRGGGEGRRTPRVRLRDSWPMGMLNCFERNFLSFVAVETKEPIRCSKCPPEFDRSRLRSIRGKSTSTTELNTTTTTKDLNTSTITEPKSTIGTNDISAISTTASGTRGTCSRFTTQSSSKLITGANANANSNSELLLPLELRGPVLVGGANKSVFEPPGVPMYPKQPVLGNVAGTQSGGRDQGKRTGFQTLLGLHPSDSSFLSLLLLLRSGSSNSMIAIDNKIEQAMDLVKAHLMLAVREEVDVLREQIKELAERNAQLERENYILRALRENH